MSLTTGLSIACACASQLRRGNFGWQWKIHFALTVSVIFMDDFPIFRSIKNRDVPVHPIIYIHVYIYIYMYIYICNLWFPEGIHGVPLQSRFLAATTSSAALPRTLCQELSSASDRLHWQLLSNASSLAVAHQHPCQERHLSKYDGNGTIAKWCARRLWKGTRSLGRVRKAIRGRYKHPREWDQGRTH